ncbi:hypothetical protein F3Y22_tig00110528pilonHSYRG00324 [Hibiscus syriacus]|uniref:Uncharacterized protein n=1 Tax=Hibiscus syriacus TaxID=106335 RepID=A0A6A3AB35_HIBSY|nr:hypothetical protein F3Y22_tig00110528pilonHSYRG00324 [Hibiscus syriacus]
MTFISVIRQRLLSRTFFTRHSKPLDFSRPPGPTQRLPLQPDTATSWAVPQMGGLGVTLLRYQLPYHRHPWCRPQCQARSYYRDLGTPESPRETRRRNPLLLNELQSGSVGYGSLQTF